MHRAIYAKPHLQIRAVPCIQTANLPCQYGHETCRLHQDISIKLEFLSLNAGSCPNRSVSSCVCHCVRSAAREPLDRRLFILGYMNTAIDAKTSALHC